MPYSTQQLEPALGQEQARAKGFLDLPDEILLHIFSFLYPSETTSLQLACRQLLRLCRDGSLWRTICFEQSNFIHNLRARGSQTVSYEKAPDTAAVATAHTLADDAAHERRRIMANWDPSYMGENVNWYDEYIQRNASVAVNWMQQSIVKGGGERRSLEARGLALYRPDNPHRNPCELETLFAVSALEDGSVCLWDVTGARGRQGGIYAKSQPGILFVNGSDQMIDPHVTEVVSVDNKLHLAFFAVQNTLVEVDLRTLAVVGSKSFSMPITTLSATDPATPLTVGTDNGIHLYDFRSNNTPSRDTDGSAKLESLEPYAGLANSAPLSILHMQRPGAEADITDEIYVAGRFPSVLLYDRRMFPTIKGSIHSGARVSSLAVLPFSHSSLDDELRRQGEMSIEQVERAKARSPDGRTLLAFGEYKTKGSLEMYGLPPAPKLPTTLRGVLSNSVFKNRQTCSSSKILSGTVQGTRLVISDGSGWIKWFERDGFTEVRREPVGHCEGEQHSSIFGSTQDSGDIARKLLPTQDQPTGRVNDNDLLLWTGENLGIVKFSVAERFTPEDFEDEARSAGEEEKEREERVYSQEMRRALERQADDVRFVRNLGLRD